jgi:cytochrome b561
MSSRRLHDADDQRYDQTTILLHWATVGLIVVLWIIGQTGDMLPRGPFRSGLWSVHVILGFVTGMILLTRVAWRARYGRVLSQADAGLLDAVARTTHYALYVLLGVTVVMGVVAASYRGFNIFGVLAMPQIGTGDVATKRAITGWHGLAANLTVAIACVHAIAAFVHQYVWRDHLLERMLP